MTTGHLWLLKSDCLNICFGNHLKFICERRTGKTGVFNMLTLHGLNIYNDKLIVNLSRTE